MLSASTHDLIFTVAIILLGVSLLPAIRKGTVMPLFTCVLTSICISAFMFNYFTMQYWLSAGVEAATVVEWLILTFFALRAKNALIPTPRIYLTDEASRKAERAHANVVELFRETDAQGFSL